MSIEKSLLSSVIAKRDFSILVRSGLGDEASWPDQVDAFRFIRDHVAKYGETPDFESVIRACPSFEAVDVVESPETLVAKLHERNVKLAERKTLETAAKMFGSHEHDAYSIMSYLERAIEDIRQDVNRRTGASIANWTKNTDERLDEYKRRSSDERGKAIPLFWSQLDGVVGGFHFGDYVDIEAAMKVGKSFLGTLAGRNSNAAGYRVLHESAEMMKSEVMARLDTIEFGISNRGIFTGTLSAEEFEEYTRRLGELRNSGRPDYIVRTPDDWPNGLTVEQLEADIEQFRPDVVVIDQFNLMEHGGGEHRHYERTSRRLRRLFAKHHVVGVVLTQANGDYVKRQDRQEDEEDDGIRELRPPRRGDYSSTIAVRQDCTHMIALDAVQWNDQTSGRRTGKARVNVEISRTGGEGTGVDLEWYPNEGVIRPRMPYDVF